MCLLNAPAGSGFACTSQKQFRQRIRIAEKLIPIRHLPFHVVMLVAVQVRQFIPTINKTAFFKNKPNITYITFNNITNDKSEIIFISFH